MLEALRGGAESSWMRCSRRSASSTSFFATGFACAAVAATSAIATYLSMAPLRFVPVCRKIRAPVDFPEATLTPAGYGPQETRCVIAFTQARIRQPEPAHASSARRIIG